MADRLQGGRLAARAIRAHDVDTVFTLSGGHVMAIYEGSARAGARGGRSPRGGGRTQPRRTGACGVVRGGGGDRRSRRDQRGHPRRQLLRRADPARRARGARPLGDAERGALQEFDQLSLLKPITKWAAVCASANRIQEYVAIAFRHALAHPRGPVYLELPADVLFGEGDVSQTPKPAAITRAVPEAAALEHAAALVDAAERPLLLGGAAIWWDAAWGELRALAERARVPVFLNGSGRGALPPDHELFFQQARGCTGAGGRRLRRRGAARLPSRLRPLRSPRSCARGRARARTQPAGGRCPRRRHRSRARRDRLPRHAARTAGVAR